MIRAVYGALPATSLLLVGFLCAPSVALATDIPCDRARSLAVPSEKPQVRIMDLSSGADDVDAADLGRNFGHESVAPVPDLSSRARSLAILREIFGETVVDDTLDVARVPAHEVPESGHENVAVRRPTAEIAGSELPPARDSANTETAEADLPGLSEEESFRYRRQMYRTDI